MLLKSIVNLFVISHPKPEILSAKQYKHRLIIGVTSWVVFIFSALFIYGSIQFNPEGDLVTAINTYVADPDSQLAYYSVMMNLAGVYVINAIPWSMRFLIATLDVESTETKVSADEIGALMMVSLMGNFFILWWIAFNLLLPAIDVIFLGRWARLFSNNGVILTDVFSVIVSAFIFSAGLLSFNLFFYEYVRKQRKWILLTTGVVTAVFFCFVGFISAA